MHFPVGIFIDIFFGTLSVCFLSCDNLFKLQFLWAFFPEAFDRFCFELGRALLLFEILFELLLLLLLLQLQLLLGILVEFHNPDQPHYPNYPDQTQSYLTAAAAEAEEEGGAVQTNLKHK